MSSIAFGAGPRAFLSVFLMGNVFQDLGEAIEAFWGPVGGIVQGQQHAELDQLSQIEYHIAL
jgi:hypothetical protein